MERRLSAILAADMVGYSRLMEADEMGTIERQKAHRRELINPAFEQYHGRIVKEMGDGILVEFASVVDAVGCALAIQRAMPEREADVKEEYRIAYRVGINLGDVVVEGDDLFGDGVNVAARLEQLSEPGGICISGTVYDQIESRSEFACSFLGEQQLKNISRPVRTYRVSVSADDAARETTSQSNPALPDKPSIAVLPFDNMSHDPDQEYFSDGMTEDIITALSRLHWLFVIARNSTFTYKGQAVDVKRVGREMGVRYVLEGSVRKAGNRVRVSAQLVEAVTGNHIWAERYDRDLVDIFDLQDELTEAISANVGAELAASERQMAHRKSGTNLGAWDLYQRGRWHYYKYTKDDFAEARRLFRRSAELSPEFAPAHAGLAAVTSIEALFGYAQDPAATLRQGLRDAERATALDERDPDAQLAIGRICMQLGDGERCISALENAVDLNPNYALAYNALGQALVWFGQADDAIAPLNQAVRLSPHDPAFWTFHMNRSIAHFFIDDFEAAIIDARAAIRAKPDDFYPYLALAAACSAAKRDDEARAALDRAYSLKPQLSQVFLRSNFRNFHPPYVEKYIGEMRKLGLPEK